MVRGKPWKAFYTWRGLGEDIMELQNMAQYTAQYTSNVTLPYRLNAVLFFAVLISIIKLLWIL